MDRSERLAQACRMSCQLAILRGVRIGETHPISEEQIANTVRIAVSEVLGMFQNTHKIGPDFSLASESDREMLMEAIARKFGVAGDAQQTSPEKTRR